MVSLTWVLMAALAAAVQPSPGGRLLADIAAHTLCPMSIEVDRNDLRIPRYIKFVRCAAEQQQCSVDRAHECCRRTGQLARECVQVDEYVPVRYRRDDTRWTNSTLRVPVGCSCMVLRSHQAVDLTYT